MGAYPPIRGQARERLVFISGNALPRPRPSFALRASAGSLRTIATAGLPAVAAGEGWWSQPGSNRRPQACKASALPTELWPLTEVYQVYRCRGRKAFAFSAREPLRSRSIMVGRGGVEPPTSRLSGVRSNHLSYRPPCTHAATRAAGGIKASSGAPIAGAIDVSSMKGHEDGGYVLWTGGSSSEDEPRRFPP